MNDLFITEFNKNFIQKIKQVLHNRFQMIDIESLIYYFDMRVERDRQQRILYLNQKIYLKKIIRDQSM